MKIYEYIDNNKLYVNKLLTSESVSGYVNIGDDGSVYASKYEQTIPLSCTNNIENELNISTFYKDRTLSEDLILPYQLNDVLINVNDTVTKTTYNTSLGKLYDNMLFLYANCYIANSNIPIELEGWYGQPSDGTSNINAVSAFQFNGKDFPAKNYGWQQTLKDNNSINISLINNIKDSTVFIRDNICYMFAITSNMNVDFNNIGNAYADRLICLKFYKDNNEEKVELILNTTYIDDKTSQDVDVLNSFGERRYDLNYTNIISFKDLRSISSDNNRFIYVLDNKGNHVYVYDVFNIINEDKLFKSRLLLYKIIGDDDALGDTNTKFVNATIARFLNNQLLVLDVGDDSIKVFDIDGNWVRTSGGKNFKNDIPADITYDIINDCYYVLTTSAEIVKFNKEFYVDSHINTNIDLTSGEYGNKIYISYNNSNVVYILTNKNVYKKFITKFDSNIGGFSFDRINAVKDKSGYWNYNYSIWNRSTRKWFDDTQNDDQPELYNVIVKCMAFCPLNENYDDIFLVINSRILRCKENIRYYTLFTNSNINNEDYIADFDVYSKNDCFIKDEYVQGFTYNKSIFKFNFNLNTLFEKIGFYPESTYDWNGILTIKTFKYVDKTYDNDLSLKIYDNENIDVNVINRIITLFYNKIEYMLNLIQTQGTNVKIPLVENLELD